METQSIDVLLSKPGIYVAVTVSVTAFVEVEPNGTCHQLKPATFERDGVLRPGRWNKGVTFYGPLARVTP